MKLGSEARNKRRETQDKGYGYIGKWGHGDMRT